MARNYAYYVDPEEEERKRLEIEEAFGPPAPDQPNLGTMTRQQISAADIEAAQAAGMRPTPVTNTPDAPEHVATDAELAEGLDAMEAEPDGNWAAYSPEEMQRAVAYKQAQGQPVAPQLPQPSLIEAELAPQPVSPIDVNPFEEELLPPAAPPPAPVDKTAASVSAEQKGVPAEPAPIGTRTAAQIAKIESEPPASARDYGNQAERMSAPAEYQKGERTDLLGFDDEEGFSREKLIKRVQELYGEESAPESRWEDEFTRERGSNRMTDAQISRRSAVIGFLGGAFEGDSSSGSRWADTQHRANQNYEEGRARARDRDQSSRRISRGMAEAIAATGQVSPEAAVQLRMNDKLVKDFGQYASAGGRAEGQGVGLSKEKLRTIAGLVKSDSADERARGLAMLQAATQIDVAEARGQTAQISPEDLVELGGSLMARRLGLSSSKQGAAVLSGDRTGLTDEQKRKADLAAPEVRETLRNEKLRNRVLGDVGTAETSADVKEENAVLKARALQQDDRKFAQKFQSEWRAAELPLKNALKGWKAMSPEGKKAFTTWTQTQQDGGLLDLANLGDQWHKAFTYAPGDQVHASRVLAAINSYVKSNSGSAVTGSEWDRVAKRVGLATGSWSPFNDPKVTEQFLMDAANAMTEDRKEYERIMGGWK